MGVTSIKSYWSEGNLFFEAAADSNYVRFKSGVKIHRRPTAEGFAAEIKSEFSDTDAGHACVAATADWKAAGATGGGNCGLQGVARLAATYTMTGGSIVGTYGQVAVNGTVNGSGIMLAGLYGLIEDGGTYTAVSHVASAWLDSHLTKTVSAGESELLYMTNNGSTTLGQVFFVYPGNKITNLFKISTASGMVSEEATGGALTAGDFRTIKVSLEGTTYYLIAAKSYTA